MGRLRLASLLLVVALALGGLSWLAVERIGFERAQRKVAEDRIDELVGLNAQLAERAAFDQELLKQTRLDYMTISAMGDDLRKRLHDLQDSCLHQPFSSSAAEWVREFRRDAAGAGARP